MSLNDWLMLLLGCFFDYRFLNRVLGAKFPIAVTLPSLLICNGLFGYANVHFPLAKTALGSACYFCVGGLLLNRLFYHGRFSKLAFLFRPAFMQRFSDRRHPVPAGLRFQQ